MSSLVLTPVLRVMGEPEENVQFIFDFGEDGEEIW
jgi:hypothetical protein